MPNICGRSRPWAKLVPLFLALALSSCSNQLVGQPALRSSAADGEGALVPNCQNVSQQARTEEFVVGLYLSTWGSVWSEAARQGVMGGNTALGGALGFDGTGTPDVPPDVEVTVSDGRVPYCRNYDAPAPQVFSVLRQVVEETLQPLGYEVRCGGSIGWVCETNYNFQEHISATWADRFRFYVNDRGDGSSYILIDRRLFISRDDVVYNEAHSVGSHESYFMTRVADALAGAD